MPIIPVNPQCVIAHALASQHFQCGLIHLEGTGVAVIGLLGRGAMRAGADRARAIVSQIGKVEVRMQAVLPIDIDTLGLGYCDVLWFL